MIVEQDNEIRRRQAVSKIIAKSGDSERIALSDWAEGLLLIRYSDQSKISKGRAAIALTAKSKVIIPALKILSSDLGLDQIDASKIDFKKPKAVYGYLRSIWKSRSLPMKAFISVTALTAVLTGGSGAGIAALGTAIGLPLSIVLGSGASVAAMFYEEIRGEKFDAGASYRTINAKHLNRPGAIKRALAFTAKLKPSFKPRG